MKTIRQIADEIGVSKQTVYKRYKGKLHTVCGPYAHTEQGVLYIEEQGETLIKQDFLQKECSVGAHTYAHTERSNGEVLEQSENVGVIAVLQTTIDTLQGQLAIKDKLHWLPPSRRHRLPRHFTREQYSSSLPPVPIRAREVETSRKNRDGLVGCFVVR